MMIETEPQSSCANNKTIRVPKCSTANSMLPICDGANDKQVTETEIENNLNRNPQIGTA